MKRLKAISKMMALVLILSSFFGMTALADSDNCHFDFPKREIYLAPGDEYHMYVWASDTIHGHALDYPTYSVYMTPHTGADVKSKKTYIWSDYMCGNSYIDIYIGEDEGNTGFTLYFYVDGIDEWDTVNVHIVDPEKSDVPSTRTNAERIKCGLDPLPVSDTELKKLVRFS